LAPIFFKEIKANWKVKTRKHVAGAEEMFCGTHQADNGICFVRATSAPITACLVHFQVESVLLL